MLLYDSVEYRASKNWAFSICSGGVVYRFSEGKLEVLLLKRNADNERTAENVDTYHLPKGHLRFNETLEKAALREIREEAGCNVRLETYLGALQDEFTFKGMLRSRSVHYFAAEWVKDLGKIDEEHDAKVWVDTKKAIKLLEPPNPKIEWIMVYRLQRFLELTSAT